MQKNIYQVKKEENESDNVPVIKQESWYIPNDCIPSEEAFSAVVNDLINDTIIDYCFQIHPAFKVGLFRVEDEAGPEDPEDIFGQAKSKIKLDKINCPYCNKTMDPTRFANHVENCNSGNGRQSGRNAKKSNPVDYTKYADSEDDYDDDEENQSDFSFSSSGRKKVARKKTAKNTARKKINRDMFPENSEDIKQFLSLHCGVKSKHTKKMCMNKKKCVQHTKEQKDQIRLLHNVDPLDQNQFKTSDDVQIDVDTVDEETSGVYIHQNISGHSTPENINEDSD